MHGVVAAAVVPAMNGVNFQTLMADVARRLLGEPNQMLSTKHEWRYGTHGSLAINLDKGTFYDHENKVGGGVLAFIERHLKPGNGGAIKWLRGELGINIPLSAKQPIATYDYTDEVSNLLYQVVHYEPKAFAQRRPDGRGGWIWGLGDVRIVPYRLPELIAAVAQNRTIYIPEGEKHVERLIALGLAATCNPMGAGKWRNEFATYFRGADVVVLPDNDKAGRDHAQQVAANLVPVAKHLRVLDLPGLDNKGDIINWLDAGGTVAELEALATATSSYTPQSNDAAKPPHGSGNCDSTDDDGNVPGYSLTDRGLYYSDPQSKKARQIHVSGPFKVVAETRDQNSNAWGVLLRWHDNDVRPHEWAMPRSMLAGETTDVRARLLDEGLFIAPGGMARDKLSDYLLSVHRKARARCVDRTGWHGNIYVASDGTAYGPTGAERVVLQSSLPPAAPQRCGTLADWQSNVAALAVRNSRLGLALSVSFVGPLIHFANETSFGIHFTGPSSIGKTIALRVAASAWGANLDSWRTTDNGLEALASANNDGLLLLDELSQVTPLAAEAISYMLGNERGKGRMSRRITLRRGAAWRLAFLSSGEISLAGKLSEIGRKVRAGQGVRMVEVLADAEAGHGLFDVLHKHADGAAFARHLEKATRDYCGTAIPAFIARLTEATETIGETIAKARHQWLDKYLPDNATGQVHRVAARFALIAAAGELATTMGILPWPEDEAGRAAATCFKVWLAERGGAGPAEITSGIAQVRSFIVAHGGSRFETIDGGDAGRTINRAGFRRKDLHGEWEFLIFPEGWREICAGHDPKQISAELLRGGFLRGDNKGKASRLETLPGLGRKRVYVLRSAILEDDGDKGDGNAPESNCSG